MKKWVLAGIVAIILIVGLLVVALFNLGPIIKMAVNTEGPKITRTKVHVDHVDVSLLSGRADLEGLRVGNPRGFAAPEAAKVGSIQVRVDNKSLTRNPVIIRKIEVIGPEITYEPNKDTDNFRAILDNLSRTSGSGGNSASAPSRAGASGKKILVRDFVVKGGKVSLYIAPGRRVTVDLPAIRLRDIGGQREGTTPAHAVREMMTAVYTQIQSPAVLSHLNRQLGQLKQAVENKVVKSLSEQLNQKAGGVVGKLKGLLDNQ